MAEDAMQPGAVNESESLTVQELREEIDILRNNLENCRTHLFALLHEVERVPESTIQEHYEELSDAIENWTEEVFHEQAEDFRYTLRRNLQKQTTAQQLQTVGLLLPSPYHQQLVEASTCNIIVTSCLIWDYLRREVFNDTYPIGMPEEYLRTISKAENVMRDGDIGENEQLRIDRWRSEALTALSTTNGFKANEREQSYRLTDGLCDILQSWIDRRSLEDAKPELRREIVVKSLKLQQTLTCSFRSYELHDSPIEPGVPAEVTAEFVYKRLDTWNRVNPKNVEAVVLRVSPSLVRLERGNQKGVQLVKAVIVVSKQVDSVTSSPERYENRTAESPADRRTQSKPRGSEGSLRKTLVKSARWARHGKSSKEEHRSPQDSPREQHQSSSSNRRISSFPHGRRSPHRDQDRDTAHRDQDYPPGSRVRMQRSEIIYAEPLQLPSTGYASDVPLTRRMSPSRGRTQ